MIERSTDQLRGQNKLCGFPSSITTAGNSDLPSDVRHFFMRQEGAGPQSAKHEESVIPYRTYGPFVNVGGDVPAGTRMYIDFYLWIK